MASFPPITFYGSGIPSSYQQNSVGFGIQAITVYNNSPCNLSFFPSLPSVRPAGQFPWGGIIVPAFYPQTLIVASWPGFAFATDGTQPFNASSLVIFTSDSPAGVPLAPFGPSGWGAGSTPNALANVNPGDPILAWQVQQLVNLLTGAMTGQVVTVSNQVNSSGASAGFAFTDRDGIGGDTFGWSGQSGFANLFSSVFGGTVFSVDESGNITIVGDVLNALSILNSTGPTIFSIAQGAVPRNYQFTASLAGTLTLLETVSGQGILQVDSSALLHVLTTFYPPQPSKASQSATAWYGVSGVPNNAQGNNGDWCQSDNGHIYFKSGGAWGVKV